ncbi:type II toxin-antitoxin system HicA family toxin [Methylomonas koyamae]
MVSLLKHFGFEVCKNSGSRRRFRNEKRDLNVFLHEPHPHHTIKVCYIRQTVEFLKENGFI